MKLISALPLLAATLLAGAAHAEDGCPTGTFSVTDSPDGLETAVLYDQFAVTATAPGGTASATCSVTARAATDGYSVYDIQYRGFANLDDTQTADLVAASGGYTASTHLDGPASDPLDLDQRVGNGPGTALVLDATLSADAASGAFDADAFIDSADIMRVAFVTEESLSQSIQQLAQERGSVVTHLGGAVDLLLGGLDPVDGPSGVHTIAGFGSVLLGASGRLDLGNWSLLGGAAFVQQPAGGAAASGALLAGAVRHVSTGGLPRFAEFGVWGSPGLGLTFARQYEDSGVTVTATGDTTASLVGIYGRYGVVLPLRAGSELALSATLAAAALNVAAYDEFTAGNVFAAAVPAGTTRSVSAKITAAWSGQLADRLGFTLATSLGRTFGGSGVIADVDWAGPVVGTAQPTTFVQYGAKLDYSLTPDLSLGAFVAGTAELGLGAHTQFGGTFSLSF